MQPLFRNIYKECDGLRELLRFEKKEIKMSKENAQNFMKMIGKGGELQDKVKAAVDSYTGNKMDPKEVFDNVLAPIAKEKGFEISFDDAKEYLGIAGDGELSIDTLKKTAGGWSWPWK